MPSLRSHDFFPIAIIGVITLVAFIVFWQIVDMVLLGASLAIVMMPLHHRLSARVLPYISAALITAAALVTFVLSVYATYIVFSSNADTLSAMFGTIGTWLNDPSTNPLTYGVPFGKASLLEMLENADALFLDYETTVMDNLSLYVFKIFVFFFSLGALIFHGDWLKNHCMSNIPPAIRRWVAQLSAVTVDTLYALYVVQVAIAVLTFFIALPVFYILGYGNVLFYSFFAAFCELIPVLGSSSTFALIGVYALALGDTRGFFIVFVFGYLIVSCVPELYVRPVLVGHRVKVNAVIMLIGIIGGILTMGLAGFVLGPVMIVLLINSFRIYASEQKARGKKGDISDFSL